MFEFTAHLVGKWAWFDVRKVKRSALAMAMSDGRKVMGGQRRNGRVFRVPRVVI